MRPLLSPPKSYDPFTVLFRNTYGFSPEYNRDGSVVGQKYVCPAKPTVITFTASRKPEVIVEDDKAARMYVVKPWDKQTQTLSVSFDHTEGAVNFNINTVAEGADR